MMTIEFARNVLGLARRQLQRVRPDDARTRSSTSWTAQRDVTDMGGTMRLGAYVAELAAGLAGRRGLRHRRSCPSATATATSSTPATARRFEDGGLWLLGHVARRPAGRVHRAATATRSGSAPRPTPSSRAGPTGPPRCSASSSAPPWPGPRAAPRTCSTSGAGRPRVRRVPDRSSFRVHPARRGRAGQRRTGSGWCEATLRAPRTATTFEREIVHHPGAVAVVPLLDDGTVVLVRQYRAAARRRRCSRSPPASATSTARPPSGTAARELAEEVGLPGRPPRAAGRVPQLARLLRRARGRSTWPPACPRCPTTARASRSST